MFNSLFGNLVSWIAVAMDKVLGWILEMTSFNLDFFTINFPIIADLFAILQGVGIALVVAIATFQLFKFFTGPLSEAKTNPVEILVRSGISFALIFWGNYGLEMIVNLFSYPYEALMNTSAVEPPSVWETAAGSLTGLASGGAGILIALIVIIVVGWNVLKLAIEVVERFLMVGVLTYTSPLVWPTISSRTTQEIFSKWFSMFLSQCLLMLLNVWSVKMIMSVIGASTGNIFFRLICALAFCKVAQRFDSYLQQIGLNAAHTGGNLLDDIVAAGSALTGLAAKGASFAATASGNAALGNSLQRGGFTGGLATAINQHRAAAQGGGKSTGAGTKVGGGGMGGSNPFDIKKNASGSGFRFTDRNGAEWYTANGQKAANNLRDTVMSGQAKYDGESDIMVGGKNYSGYSWTDANGKTYSSNSLNGIRNTQDRVRAGYGGAHAVDAHPIRKNPDGTYSWTADNGTDWTSNTLEDAKITRDSVLNGGSGGVHGVANNSHTAGSTATGSLSNIDRSAMASNLFNADGTPKQGATRFDEQGREILSGTSAATLASTVANASTPEAMQTGAGRDTASVIKADTVASTSGMAQALMRSDVPGGIQDGRVNAAAFSQMYGGAGVKVPQNGIDSVIPGLSESVAATNGDWTEGAGDVYDMSMRNGEMRGTYVPVGQEDDQAQNFSIKNQDAYNAMSPAERAAYTPFTGADGETYYARTTPASENVDPNISGMGVQNGAARAEMSEPGQQTTATNGGRFTTTAPGMTIDNVPGVNGPEPGTVTGAADNASEHIEPIVAGPSTVSGQLNGDAADQQVSEPASATVSEASNAAGDMSVPGAAQSSGGTYSTTGPAVRMSDVETPATISENVPASAETASIGSFTSAASAESVGPTHTEAASTEGGTVFGTVSGGEAAVNEPTEHTSDSYATSGGDVNISDTNVSGASVPSAAADHEITAAGQTGTGNVVEHGESVSYAGAASAPSIESDTSYRESVSGGDSYSTSGSTVEMSDVDVPVSESSHSGTYTESGSAMYSSDDYSAEPNAESYTTSAPTADMSDIDVSGNGSGGVPSHGSISNEQSGNISYEAQAVSSGGSIDVPSGSANMSAHVETSAPNVTIEQTPNISGSDGNSSSSGPGYFGGTTVHVGNDLSSPTGGEMSGGKYDDIHDEYIGPERQSRRRRSRRRRK